MLSTSWRAQSLACVASIGAHVHSTGLLAVYTLPGVCRRQPVPVSAAEHRPPPAANPQRRRAHSVSLDDPSGWTRALPEPQSKKTCGEGRATPRMQQGPWEGVGKGCSGKDRITLRVTVKRTLSTHKSFQRDSQDAQALDLSVFSLPQALGKRLKFLCRFKILISS